MRCALFNPKLLLTKELKIMADEGDVLTNLDNPGAGANGADNLPTAAIITQYVKDLSVENPNAPDVYQWTDQPTVDVQFNIGAEPFGDEVHEVTLKINVNATGPKGPFYMVELAFCGLVGIRNVPEDQAHAFLYAEAPRLIFPFARNVVSDAVRDAGFPPLLIDPIDFAGLYSQQLAQRRAEQGLGEGEVPKPQA